MELTKLEGEWLKALKLDWHELPRDSGWCATFGTRGTVYLMLDGDVSARLFMIAPFDTGVMSGESKIDFGEEVDQMTDEEIEVWSIQSPDNMLRMMSQAEAIIEEHMIGNVAFAELGIDSEMVVSQPKPGKPN